MEEEDLQVIEAMERQGGSFVEALANAFRKADQTNFNKLKDAFANYWKVYTEVANEYNKMY